jgi:hypothetical protein
MKSHGEFADSMEEHCKEIEIYIQRIKELKLKNAAIVAALNV